ncbi:MAG TPA: hypothetical protein VKJ47_15815 [Candidatus Binatia bacterium]|nr:hypothetical protein [Candidatus Binatia bacterium]
MWNRLTKSRRVRALLLAGLVCACGCSAQRQDAQKDMQVDASDPFSDPFFTKPPAWDDSVLQQSEVLTKEDEEEKKPQSFLERTEGVVFSTLMVGGTLAQMALPFLGL